MESDIFNEYRNIYEHLIEEGNDKTCRPEDLRPEEFPATLTGVNDAANSLAKNSITHYFAMSDLHG